MLFVVMMASVRKNITASSYCQERGRRSRTIKFDMSALIGISIFECTVFYGRMSVEYTGLGKGVLPEQFCMFDFLCVPFRL